MSPLAFQIDMTPIAEPRKRVARRGKFLKHYTPKEHPVNAYREAVALAGKAAMAGRPPITGPIRVDCVFVFPRPKSKQWSTKPTPRYWHESKPDRDNLDKSTLDALTGICWRDDAQICEGLLRKYVAAGGELPHVRITITEPSEIMHDDQNTVAAGASTLFSEDSQGAITGKDVD